MNCKIVQVDKKGNRWIFEGFCGGEPLFVQEHEARPKILKEGVAKMIIESMEDNEDECIVENC